MSTGLTSGSIAPSCVRLSTPMNKLDLELSVSTRISSNLDLGRIEMI